MLTASIAELNVSSHSGRDPASSTSKTEVLKAESGRRRVFQDSALCDLSEVEVLRSVSGCWLLAARDWTPRLRLASSSQLLLSEVVARGKGRQKRP